MLDMYINFITEISQILKKITNVTNFKILVTLFKLLRKSVLRFFSFSYIYLTLTKRKGLTFFYIFF